MSNDHLDGCTGKKSFATKKQAERRAKAMRRKFHNCLTEYHCEHCRQWHIGGRDDARFGQ